MMELINAKDMIKSVYLFDVSFLMKDPKNETAIMSSVLNGRPLKF